MLAERTAGQQPIRVDFFGTSGQAGRDFRHFDLGEEIRRQGFGGTLSIHGEVPQDRSLAEMFRSDILLLFDTPGRRIGVPAKLYEYIGAGRTILAMAESDSDTAWVLRQAGSVYRIVNPSDPQSIQQGLRELVDVIENGHSTIEPSQGRLQFTRENLSRQLADVLKTL